MSWNIYGQNVMRCSGYLPMQHEISSYIIENHSCCNFGHRKHCSLSFSPKSPILARFGDLVQGKGVEWQWIWAWVEVADFVEKRGQIFRFGPFLIFMNWQKTERIFTSFFFNLSLTQVCTPGNKAWNTRKTYFNTKSLPLFIKQRGKTIKKIWYALFLS